MADVQPFAALMTTEQAAAYLAVKPSWLRDHPEVPRVKLGRLVRYRVADLEAWIDAQQTQRLEEQRSAPPDEWVPGQSWTSRSRALTRSPRSRRTR